MTIRAIDKIIAGTRHLLLDFDGPICSIFAGTSAEVVANRLREALETAGFRVPHDSQADSADPLEVFRLAAGMGQHAAGAAQQLLTVLETQSVATAQPTEGSTELIATAHRTGRTVTIVSNNSGAAISAYLNRHNLTRYIRTIVARDDDDPRRMKPSPDRIREALAILEARNAESTFVGDSTTDVFAGLLAGVPVIGYANKPGKVRALAEAHAAAIVTDLAEITAALKGHVRHGDPAPRDLVRQFTEQTGDALAGVEQVLDRRTATDASARLGSADNDDDASPAAHSLAMSHRWMCSIWPQAVAISEQSHDVSDGSPRLVAAASPTNYGPRL